MTYFTELALKRASVTILAFLLVLGYGIFTFSQLPVEVLPRVQFPLLTVSASYPNAGSEDVVQYVTEPLEKQVSGLEGLNSVQSITFEGSTLLLMFYDYGIDMDVAKKEVESRLVSMDLPGIMETPTVNKLDPGAQAVLEFSFITEGDINSLQDIVSTQIEPSILGIDGVSDVVISGIQKFDVVVNADTESLFQNDISLDKISQIFEEMNFSMSSGFIFDGTGVVSLRTSHSVSTLQDLQNIAIGSKDGNPVLLRDVATISKIPSSSNSISRTNGNPSVGVSVFKDPEANTVDVTQAVLNSANSQADKAGLDTVVIYNAGPDIESQLQTLFSEGIYGFLFAVGGVFIFLLNIKPGLMKGLALSLRPTIVIALTIPVSILGGVLIMGFTDLTLNVMTLGGLALAVGRVVDDSIVVLENVYRHMQMGESKFDAALSATKEVAAAITSSTIATIVVFAPLAFIQGLVGSFFLPFCIAVSSALFASLIVSITFVPVVGAAILRPGDMIPDTEKTGSLSFLQRIYKPALIWSLQHKIITILIALILTMGSVSLPALGLIPVTLFPTGPARILSVDISVPPILTEEQKLSKVLDLEKELKSRLDKGEIENFVTTIGGSGVFSNPDEVGGFASIFVRLTSEAPDDVAEVLTNQFPSESYGTQYEFEELNAAGPPQPGVEVKIVGNNLEDLSRVNDELLVSLRSLDGVDNIESDLTGTRPEMNLVVNSSIASTIGMTPQEVAMAISAPMKGQDLGDLVLNEEEVNLKLKLIAASMYGTQDPFQGFNNLSINGPLGSATIGELVTMNRVESPITIARTDTNRSATITGKIINEDSRSVQMAIDAEIDAIELPNGIEIQTGGIFSDIAEGFQDIFLAMAISIILVFLVVSGSLGSLRDSLVILLSLPLASIGAFVGLAITGRSLGLPAMMGLLLLIGLVVTNAIVLIAFVQQLREENFSVREALVEGGLVRLRPILMTAFTTGLALLPLAAFVGNEGGGIIGEDLATVVIGGLASSTFLTLLIVPIAYEFMHSTLPKLFGRNKRDL